MDVEFARVLAVWLLGGLASGWLFAVWRGR